MRILHISKYYYPFIGGIEQTAKDIVESLTDNNIQKVLCFNHKKGNCVEKINNIEVTRLSCQAKISSQSISIFYGKRLRQLIKEFRPELVIFHYPNPFAAHYLLMTLPKGIKLLLWWHLDITKQKVLGKLFSRQNERLLQRANCVVATSRNYIDSSEYLKKYKEKCIVIPSCINEKRLVLNEKRMAFSDSIKSRANDKMICFSIGRLVEYKGFSLLIEVAKKFENKCIFYIAGNGPLYKELRKKASELSNVVLLGKITDDELVSYLMACDVYCFPSITRNEAFGLALAEAMYFGKPAVTFNIPGSGVNYVNLANVTGLECKNSNIEEFCNAINELIASEELRMKLGNNAKQRICNEFMFSVFSSKVKELVEGFNDENQ